MPCDVHMFKCDNKVERLTIESAFFIIIIICEVLFSPKIYIRFIHPKALPYTPTLVRTLDLKTHFPNLFFSLVKFLSPKSEIIN